MVAELGEIAEPFEHQISSLLDALLGPRPAHGIAEMQIYPGKRRFLRERILEILEKTRKLPTVTELKKVYSDNPYVLERAAISMIEQSWNLKSDTTPER
jgi:hypothetical protein